MDLQFGQLEQLNWLWLVVACALTMALAAGMRARAIRQFATPNLLSRVLPPNRTPRKSLAAICACGTLLLLVVTLVDIRWGKVWREVPQRGIEVNFVLDVSRSMLADDVTPNRLERAKQQIKDIVEQMAGDRVGLVIFAGDAKQQIPLTNHYEDFKQGLDAVDTLDIRRGGSQLGQAIDVAANSFLSKTNDHQAMVIFTDGEDHESQPVAAARRAYKERGIRIFAVGLGDMEQGSRIPIETDTQQTSSQYLQYKGQPVWSKLNGEILRQIATETNGAYIPAGTKQVNMSDVYHRYITNVEQQEFETARINSYAARFPWFLGAALWLLLAEVAMQTWPVRRNPDVATITGAATIQARRASK